MSSGQKGKAGTGALGASHHNAAQIYTHQRCAEALAAYAPEVLPVLQNLLRERFVDSSDYGIDDNIDNEGEARRYGWRIFYLSAVEAKFNDATYSVPERRTALLVELLFDEDASPTGYLVDTRRTRTAQKTGLFGLRQTTTVTLGASKVTPLDVMALSDAIDELADTMER